jgi:hypothetical protein
LRATLAGDKALVEASAAHTPRLAGGRT